MALAYVNGNNSSGTGTSLTYSVDCTSADILLVGIAVSSGTVSTVTYNGVSMTLDVSNTTNTKTYIYRLNNPTTSTNDVVITPSGSTTVYSCAVAYSGASSTGQPDATNSYTEALTDTVGVSVTTIDSDCVVVAFGINIGATTITRTSSGNTRQSSSQRIMFDSGTVASPSSFFSEFTSNYASGAATICVASIKPSITTTNSGFFALI
jgi:hypothetical protein